MKKMIERLIICIVLMSLAFVFGCKEKDTEPNEPVSFTYHSKVPPLMYWIDDDGNKFEYVPKAPNIPEGVNILVPGWKIISKSGTWSEPNEPCKDNEE